MLIKLKYATSVVLLVTTLSGCLTTPSLELIDPTINVPAPKPAIPADVLVGCESLTEYTSNDTRDVIKTTIQNHNVYFLCASKLKSAINIIKLLQDLE